METRKDFRYEAYDTPGAKSLRIPQQKWEGGPPLLGANCFEVARGMVSSFSARVGWISTDASDDDVFFSFTAIPGEGYRTLRPGTPVSFELVENERGSTARNIRQELPA